MSEEKKFVNYEDFGAVGDGVADDIDAIIAAHAYANAHNLPVKTKPDATYYIGRRAKTAIIQTDVDWNTSRFTIDDTDVEDNKVPCFDVCSALKPVEIKLDKLSRDQKQVDVHPETDCFVTVYNANVKHFIRYGLNPSPGTDATDCFVLRRDGSIYGPIDWDYDVITKVEAQPIDDKPLTLKGGVFTTMANREESKYNYYQRNIEIHRSNVIVDSITHYVAGEIGHGAPYRGFISAERCAFITVQNCFATGHKIYVTIGRANLPVSMGSYDLHANSVVDVTFRNCRINNITDNTRWGVIATNFCKNLLVEDCIFSRLDAHQGVSGTYTIRNSQMGWQGINAIGRGLLTLDNVTANGHSLINFRGDYGSTWEGDIEIKNCRWIPSCGNEARPIMFNMANNGMHDFGYPCFMPETITIDGLRVEDSNTPADYEGLTLFADPDGTSWGPQLPLKDVRPHPYTPCRKVTIHGLTCASNKAVSKVCENPEPFKDTEIMVNGRKFEA